MTFKEFWTNENNPILKETEYMFHTRHIVVLLVAIIATVMLAISFSSKSEKAKQRLLRVFAWSLLGFEILSRIVNCFVVKHFTLANIIRIIFPLEICSVVVWVLIFAVFTKKELLYEFVATIGLLATAVFLLFPAVGLNRVNMSFTCVYSIVTHIISFVCSVLVLTFGYAKFEIKKIWQLYLCVIGMFAWGAVVDFLLIPGSNYMYLRTIPIVLNINFPYQILYGLFVAIYVFAFYLLQMFKHHENKNNLQKNAKSR